MYLSLQDNAFITVVCLVLASHKKHKCHNMQPNVTERESLAVTAENSWLKMK